MVCKSAQVLLVIFLLSFFFSEVRTEAELVATASCVSCTLSCPSGTYCIKVAGGNFTKEICSPLPCFSASPYYKVGITTCSTDYNGVTCTNSLCYYEKNRTAACYPFFPSASCVTTSTESRTCSTSCSSSSCQTCQKIQSSALGYQENCLGYNCNLYTDKSSTLSACPSGKDQDGKTCACCIKSTLEPHRACLSTVTNDTQVVNYSKTYLTNANNSTNNGNWENSMRIWIGVAVALIGVLAY